MLLVVVVVVKEVALLRLLFKLLINSLVFAFSEIENASQLNLEHNHHHHHYYHHQHEKHQPCALTHDHFNSTSEIYNCFLF